MSEAVSNITVNVDVTNPGQFFACCGLLELADRLWPGAEGWFERDDHRFLLAAKNGTLEGLVRAIATAELTAASPSDPYGTPVIVGRPFRQLVIDWWETDMTGARDLKVWAGTMESFGIAQAMQHAMRSAEFCTPDLFDVGMVVTTAEDAGKKKEPYYFDARRAPNAHSRDIGFSPNDLGMTTIAHPAVELLCLIGLQAARPSLSGESRVYDYCTWHTPLLPSLLLAASTGSLHLPGARTYRFENWFRTGQRKHKAFRRATALTI
jgi:CRISPR-associated protein Csb3